jgi:hypothetical protein
MSPWMRQMLTIVSFSSHPKRITDLRTRRPPPVLSNINLREIYLDRIDPLVKILHRPTFWNVLTNGVRHPHDLSKSFQAVMFTFYLTTITALEEKECQKFFETQKSVIYTRYRRATRQALVNAGFLSTSSTMTLQVYAMFMVSCEIQAPYHQ